MKRHEWKFDYTSSELAEAAQAKRDHHAGRLAWWQDRQAAIISEVKEKGLEVQESISSEYGSASMFAASGALRGAQLTVKHTYQEQLNECHKKIYQHAEKVKEYAGWLQLLQANPDLGMALDIDDFLFFFGK